jgi:hypothetical protein
VNKPFGRFDGGGSKKDPLEIAFVLEEISGEGEGDKEERGTNGTNPFGKPLEALLAAPVVTPAIVFPAVEGDAKIGTNAFGILFEELGLANVGSGPQSKDTGAEVGPKVVVVVGPVASELALSGAGLFLNAEPPLWPLFGFSLLPLPLPPGLL